MSNAFGTNQIKDPTILEEMIRRAEAAAIYGSQNQASVKVQPPPPSQPKTPFQEALIKVGMPRNDVYSAKTNGDVVLSVKEHIAETVKWHRAMIKVYEFMEAQLNIDLFKDDPEAKAIYTSWISKGLMALRNEAGGGIL